MINLYPILMHIYFNKILISIPYWGQNRFNFLKARIMYGFNLNHQTYSTQTIYMWWISTCSHTNFHSFIFPRNPNVDRTTKREFFSHILPSQKQTQGNINNMKEKNWIGSLQQPFDFGTWKPLNFLPSSPFISKFVSQPIFLVRVNRHLLSNLQRIFLKIIICRSSKVL